MRTINNVTLLGKIGHIEPYVYLNGSKVVSFTLCTKHNTTNTKGEKNQEKFWHYCVAKDKIAEYMLKHSKRYTKALVQGCLEYHKYTKDNVEKVSCRISVKNLSIIDSELDELVHQEI